MDNKFLLICIVSLLTTLSIMVSLTEVQRLRCIDINKDRPASEVIAICGRK